MSTALVTSGFVGSGVLYATGGGDGPGVSRLGAAGLGGAAALGAVQVMGWLFPYSPMFSERRRRVGCTICVQGAGE